MSNPLTPEQEAEARYTLGWGNQQDSINSTLQSGFTEGADWQSEKDKERIEKLLEEIADLKHERDHLNFIIQNSTITKPTP